MLKKLLYISLICIGIAQAAIVNTNKDTYANNQQVLVDFSELTGLNNDWIGIYPEGSTNDWVNMVQWNWTGDITEGNLVFNALPVGNYEVRTFYNNSFVLETSKKFKVEAGVVVTAVTTDKETYLLNEAIVATYANMTGGANDWIAIYPAGSSTAWANMIQWEWIAGEVAGAQNFGPLPVGEYEVRVFFNNSFTMEASHAFSVTANNVVASVETAKNIYLPNEKIVSAFDNMSGNAQDWIAIYPAGSSNAWANMIQWEWVAGEVAGNHIFDALPVGNYEVRVFFNNTFNVEASHAFSVEAEVIEGMQLKSRKEIYDPFELIHAEFTAMRGTASDWIGIFPVGADNQKGSAIQWKYAKSLVNGELSFNGLPIGNYEMRAYFATLHKKTINFAVGNTEAVKTVYEDAEGGFKQVWVSDGVPVTIINEGAQGSVNSIRTTKYTSSYFSFANPDKKMKFLELDTRIGTASHVGNFGVLISTKHGDRRIIFSSYMNHPGNVVTNNPEDFADPFTEDGYLHNHPGPTDYTFETQDGSFVHYKINIEEKLRILEPDNELLSILLFTSAGGDFDNVSLVSH